MTEIDIGRLVGYLTINDEGSKTLLEFTRNLDTAGGKMDDFGRRVRQIGVGMLPFSVGIAAAGAAVVKQAADFETSFTSVRKTIDASEAEFKQLETQFRTLAKTIPVTVNEINEVAAAGGQLGVKNKDLLEFTRTMVDMGIATNLSSMEAGDSLARFANIMQNEAGPNFKMLGNVVADLGNKSAATEKDIVTFGLRLAGAGKQAGMSEPEILSLASALASLGLNAEAGSTAFSKTIQRMSLAVATGGEKLDKIAQVAGMTSQAFAQLFKEDAAEGLQVFLDGLNRVQISGGNLFKVLGELDVAEVRLRDSLLRTASASSLVREQFDIGAKAAETNNALTIEAEKRYATFASQLTKFKNNLNDVGITLGNAIIPVLLDFLNQLKPVVEFVARGAEEFAKLPSPIRTVGIALAGIMIVVPPMIIAFGQLYIGLGGLVSTFGLVSGAVSLLGNTVPILTARVWLLEASFMGIVGAAARILGPLAAAGTALALIYDYSQKNHIANQRTVEDIEKEIEVLKKVGGQMALSRLQSLESALAERKHAEAAGGVTEAMGAMSEGLKGAANSFQTLKDRLTGLDKAKDVQELSKAISELRIHGELTPDVLARVNKEILALQASGAKLTPEMESMLKTFGKQGPVLDEVTTKTKQYSTAVKELSDTLSGQKGSEDLKKLEDAWKRLTPAQKQNADIIKRVVEQYASLRDTSNRTSEEFDQLTDSVKTQTPEWHDLMQELQAVDFVAQRLEEGQLAEVMRDTMDSFKESNDVIAEKTDALTKLADAYEDVLSEARNAEGLALMEKDRLAMENSLLPSIGRGFMGAIDKVPDIIVEGIVNGASWGKIGVAVGTRIASDVGKAIGGSIGYAVGGTVGKTIGEAIGQTAGALVAPIADALHESQGEKLMKDVGHRWGVVISEELADTIAQEAKRTFGGSHAAAELFNFDALLKAGGGLTGDNIKSMTANLRDVFSMVETGAFSSAQAITVLNDVFGDFADFFGDGLISRDMQEIIDLYRRFGIQAEEVEKFLQKQAVTARNGFDGILKGIIQVEEKEGKLNVTTAVTQEQFDRLQRLAAVTFEAGVTSGAGFLATLMEMGDQLDTMNLAAEQFGFTKIAAFGDISALENFFEANQTVADSIMGVDSMLKGLYNSSLLNQETFSDLGAITVENFNKMTSAGLTSNQALMAQQSTLQTLWEIAQDGNLVLDEQTQILIDQAQEAGLVGEAHMDAQERATRAMESAADAMTRVGDILVEVFGAAGDESENFASRAIAAIDQLPTEVTFTYRGVYAGVEGDIPVVPMASGGSGMVTRPTYFLAGEAGAEEYAFSGAGKRFGNGVNDNTSTMHDDYVHSEIKGLRRDINRVFDRMPIELASALKSTL